MDNRHLEEEDQKLIGYSGKTIDDSVVEQEKRQKKKKWIIIGLIVAALVILIIVLAVTLTRPKADPTPDPGPGPGPTPTPPIVTPQNPYALDSKSFQSNGDTITGHLYAEKFEPAKASTLKLSAELGAAADLKVDPFLIPQGVNNKLVQNVTFTFGMTDFKVGHLVMRDATAKRYEIPDEVFGPTILNPTMRMEMLGFQLFTNPFSFSFADLRNQSNVYVHTNGSTLVMMDKYIQMDFELPTQRNFGFGERIHEFTLGDGAWTMWAKGQDSPYDQGLGGKGVYGVHPFILVQSQQKGDFFGMFFKNSNAQSPVLKHNSKGGSTLSYITTGGVIDVYFFVHGSAKEIIQSYHNVIGKPTLPPFWALGWHQASWKYENQTMVEEVVGNYTAAGMPLETVWLDIPYLDGYADFTVNKTAFPSLDVFTKKLHDNNQHLVVILDAGLSADDVNNVYYQMALKAHTLIMSTLYNEPLKLKVWPNETVFMDWFANASAEVWGTGLQDLYAKVPYDGIWIDMNEATGFTQGELNQTNSTNGTNTTNVTHGPLYNRVQASVKALKRFLQLTLDDQQENNWFDSAADQTTPSAYDLPFIPGFWEEIGVNATDNTTISIFRRFDNMSLSLNATHPSNNLTEYDVHNLYGLMMARRTFEFLTNQTSFSINATIYPNSDRRAFILTRSTFASSGKYASHWLGDNWRDWDYMKYSIAGIMNMNMFGIPLAGADVCGFFGPTREDEMCGRWIQLATFYPFARAHQNLTYYGNTSERSEPYNLSAPYKEMAKDSLFDRYQYLRHLYTCLFEVHQNGGTCFDPLFYYYPEDDNLFDNPEQSFIVGGALKVSPILAALGTNTTFVSYFPKGKWVSLRDFTVLDFTLAGGNATLPAANTVQVHLKEGSIIPFQNNSQKTISTTTDALNAPVSLIVHLDHQGYATGTLYVDTNGDSRADLETNKYEYYRLVNSDNSLKVQLEGGQSGSVTAKNSFVDVITYANGVALLNTNFACSISNDGLQSVQNLAAYYNTTTMTLSITSATPGGLLDISEIRQIFYGNDAVDLNLCNPDTYTYAVYTDDKQTPINLTSNNVTFSLIHKSKSVPALKVQLQLLQNEFGESIVNFNITYDDPAVTWRKHLPVDIGAEPLPLSPLALSTFVKLAAPGSAFTLDVFTAANVPVYHLERLLFDDFFMVLSSTVQIAKIGDGSVTTGVWGLGERVSSFFYADGVYTSLARDAGSPFDNGKAPGNSMYGHHPIFFGRAAEGAYFGVFNLNAAAADFYIKNNAGSTDVTQVTIGGIFDVYIFLGSTPDTVVRQYHSVVGKPVFIPQWGLGWHQCRWGYDTTQALQDVVDAYAANGIPLDVMWSDIDYLDTYRDFTHDPVKFAGLPTFIDGLHNTSRHYVPIIDAGVARRPWGNYSAYADGSATGAFMMIGDAGNEAEFIGQVWPNDAVFPDFLGQAGQTFWKKWLTTMHSEMAFDGLWQDMNEASNFCDGVCYQNQQPQGSVVSQLKYVPGARIFPQHAISLDAMHANGQQEVDTHNLFGFSEVRTTAEWYAQRNERPFIISRSTFAGQGKYGSHWLGDNQAQAASMGQQVIGIMMMNMFGIPVSGADICGFGGNTTAELCARWTVVGSFSPFSRNHNSWYNIAQEPYRFQTRYEEGTNYTQIMTSAIRNRYHLVRYYYTQLYLVNQAGGAFYKPVFHEYPMDPLAYTNMTYNIMLGDALKLSVLSDTLNQNSTTFYYPADTWCNVFNSSEKCWTSTGQKLEQQTKAQDFYLYLRAGKVLPYQEATAHVVNTTAQLQNMPVDFHVSPLASVDAKTFSADGHYYNDNGTVLNLDGNGNFYNIKVTGATGGNLIFAVNTLSNATQYPSKTVANCTAVNQNDFVGSISLYNAKLVGLNVDLPVFATTLDGTKVPAGSAVYTAASDRLVATLTAPLCLTTLASISFEIPTPTPPPSILAA